MQYYYFWIFMVQCMINEQEKIIKRGLDVFESVVRRGLGVETSHNSLAWAQQLYFLDILFTKWDII